MKVGLIGAGRQGKRRARVLQQSEDTELIIVADANYKAAGALADSIGCRATSNWEDVVALEDVEAILVCAPPNLHMSMSIAALEQGKHVLCEKPLARTVDEARKIVAVAHKNKAKLKCGFNLRHHPGIQQARKWLDEGLLGTPTFIRCRYGIGGRPGYEKEWRMKPEISGGGQLMDQGMHVLDLIQWFLGDVSEVFGFLQTAYWDIAPVEDNAFALLRTEKGQVASLHVSWTEWKNLFSFEISGKDGYIVTEGLSGSYGIEKATIGRRAFLAPFKEELIEFRGEDLSWQEEWKEFASAIKEDREPLGSGLDGLQALRLADALYESARTGCAVKIENL